MESRDKAPKRRRKRPRHSLALECFGVFVLASLSTSTCRSLSLQRAAFGIRNQNEDHRKHVRSCRRLVAISMWSRENPEGQPNVSPSFFPPEQLAGLKESINIVDVIESYNLPKFQRRGDTGAISICPFHEDRNPSMNIDDKRKIYKCFSCGAGGDVFKFVRDYRALKGEEFTFYESVREVASSFGNLQLGSPSRTGTSRTTEEESAALQEKKKRLLLINAAAAAYFGKSLISLPSAGQARSHLRNRGLSPTTVRTFALGYAPDCYFGLKGNNKWGEGSLVHNLKELGFTADEILDSGLATRTKRASISAADSDMLETMENYSKEKPTEFTTLMDRFRGRIMVPIFDASGKNVIAFGGRILPSLEKGNDNSDFVPPKYLNSPESLIFHKSSELFGLHFAKEAIHEQKAKTEQGAQRLPGSIVIVEGYMDVISLWEANIKNAVACMGTALTMEQLTSAAKAAGTMEGRIILCLDNDEAGMNAVERVCSNMFLTKISEKYGVEIVIGSLPVGIKDPADFIQTKNGDADFQKRVIANADDWTTWYLKQILARYNEKALRGTPGSFGNMCDRVSEFLATFPNPADRTKRAHDIASNLAEVVSARSGSSQVSNSFRIQLESDLVDMVSRKASVKESLGRRIEAVDGFSPKQLDEKLSQMSRGAGSNVTDDSIKFSAKAFKAANPIHSREQVQRLKPTPVQRDERDLKAGPKGNSAKKNPRKFLRSAKEQASPMTPHFKGFAFENESDADWLGLSRQKSKRKKGDLVFGTNERYQKQMLNRFGASYAPGLKDNVIYFNSDEYHGQQFLTQEAMHAGYTNNGPPPRDRSFLERGVATLVKEDPVGMIRRGEEALLRNLVQYGSARSAIRTAIATSDATGSTFDIEWSSVDRQWLFTYLVEREDEIPFKDFEDDSKADLREYLATREDVPEGAFFMRGFEMDRNLQVVTVDPTKASALENNIFANEFNGVTPVDQELQIPSDTAEIEDWASSYDPGDFQDDVSMHDFVPQQDLVLTKQLKSARTDASVIDTKAILDDTIQNTTSANSMHNSHSHTHSKLSKTGPQTLLGSLDHFFLRQEDIFSATYDESVPRELRAELEVQEALATLLKASALKRLESVNAYWLVASRLMNERLELAQTNQIIEQSIKTSSMQVFLTGIHELDSMEMNELQEHCQGLFRDINDLFQTAHKLEVSWKRIKSKIVNCIAGDSAEGKMSSSQYDELVGKVDDFLRELPDDWQPNEIEDLLDPDYVLSLYESDDTEDDNRGLQIIPDNLSEGERFELDMDMIEKEWSGWDDPTYRWSSGDADGGANFHVYGNEIKEFEANAYSNEIEESLEDALVRIEHDWAEWSMSEDTDVTIKDLTSSTQQSLLLQYSNAQFGDYRKLQEPKDDPPSYCTEEAESEHIHSPRVVSTDMGDH